MISKRKQEENESGAWARFWDRLIHFMSFKGINTEAEYAEKVIDRMNKPFLKTLKKWDGKSLQDESVKAAILQLSPKEIEKGAREDLFKLDQHDDLKNQYEKNQFRIMDLFDTDIKKSAFLMGIAQRDDSLLQVSHLIAYGFDESQPEDYQSLHEHAKGHAIESKILKQFIDLQKYYQSNNENVVDNSKERLNAFMVKTLQKQRISQNKEISSPSYFQQYIAELFIQQASSTNNFDKIADLLELEDGHDLPVKMKPIMKKIFNSSGTNDPAFPLLILSNEDLKNFRENVKSEAFDTNSLDIMIQKPLGYVDIFDHGLYY